MKADDIPAPTMQRLSLYLRHLETCRRLGQLTISSRQLGAGLKLTDAQVRKDLAHFGPFGHPGIGYRVHELVQRLRRILGTDKPWKVILVGAGNLGRALAAYPGFLERGFEIVAVFDAQPGKCDRALPGTEALTVLPTTDLEKRVRDSGVKLGILAVSADGAQQAADLMIAAGIKGILNFAPVVLNVPHDVTVTSVDLAVQLEQLSCRTSGRAGGAGARTRSGSASPPRCASSGTDL